MKNFPEVITLLTSAVDDDARDRILTQFASHIISCTQKAFEDHGTYDLVRVEDIPEFQFADQNIQQLWDDLGNVPVIEDAEMLAEYVEDMEEDGIIVDATLLNKDPYIDEDFFLWKRGTAKYVIWEWFDEHYFKGVESLAYGGK